MGEVEGDQTLSKRGRPLARSQGKPTAKTVDEINRLEELRKQKAEVEKLESGTPSGNSRTASRIRPRGCRSSA
jgi:hypothetical protein